MLCVGGSAWAQDTYETVYTRAAVSDWKETDKADWGGNSNLTIDATYGLYFNTTKPGSAYSATKSFEIEENAKVKYEVNWYTGNSTGRDSNYEYIKFGDKVCIGYNSNYRFYLSLTGSCAMTNDLSGSQNKTPGTSTITIIFNTATKKVESFFFRGTDITNKVADALEGNFNSLTFGLQRGGSTSNWGYPNGLVTVTVSQCKQTVSIANYTINYKLGDAVVKTVSSSSVVGAEIDADMAIDGEGDYAGNHYVITADAVPSMTLVAGENVLNVPVRVPYTATLNVTTTINGTANVQSINLTESDTKSCAWSYAYPKYVKSGDIYYLCDASTFVFSGTFTDGQTIEQSVNYPTADESIIFYQEAESTASTNPDYSWGGSGHVAAQNARDRGISVGTLPAGNYTFTVNFTAANKRSLVIRQSTNDPLALVGTSNEDMTTGLKHANFTLSAETTGLWINGANSGEAKTNQSEDFDYVLISKMGSKATIGATGYTTFASAEALDLANLPEGLTAYVATSVDDTDVHFTSIETAVPAGTGLLLKGDASTSYSIPVAASAEAVSGNRLVGCTEQTTLEANANYYVMVNNGGSAEFQSLSSKGATIPAGKAYLNAATVAGARLRIVFNNETTGISTLENANVLNENYYNLSGQRIAAPQKGLYIVNGKKVIIK